MSTQLHRVRCRRRAETADRDSWAYGRTDRPREDARVLDRRRVLQTGLAVAASVPFGRAWAADPAPSGLTARDLPGGLHLITGAGGAVVAMRGPEGAVMVDAGTADKAEALQALVLQKTGAKT